MQLHEFIEKEKEKLDAFRNYRIVLHDAEPKKYPLDMEDHQWIAVYMVYLTQRGQL